MNDADGAPDLDELAGSTARSAALVSERAYAAYTDAHTDSGLEAATPEAGTVALDYRVANVAAPDDEARVNEAIVALVEALVDEDGAAIRTAHFIRPTDGTRLADGAGVGDVRLIESPDPEFSIDRGPGGTPYREVVPIAPIMDKTDGRLNRDVLADAVEDSLSNLRGGTGLYETALAAFKAVYDTYDPAYSNSVILMTDGRNEGTRGLSLTQLVSELNTRTPFDSLRSLVMSRVVDIMQNPTRRIPIITVGISDDADADALEQISAATGGSSFIAHDPNDIGAILLRAVSFRAGAA